MQMTNRYNKTNGQAYLEDPGYRSEITALFKRYNDEIQEIIDEVYSENRYYLIVDYIPGKRCFPDSITADYQISF